MNLKILSLLACLIVCITYGCEDKGLAPMDKVPIVDTTWKVLINEVKGNYLGTCYIHNMTSMIFFDTLYNVTITIDSLERIKYNDKYFYILTDGAGIFTFIFSIPETEFIQDTINAHAIGPSQRYSKTIRLIRSQRFLYAKWGVYPGLGFQTKQCYCTKQ